MSVTRNGAELGHFEDAEVAVAVVADCVGLAEQLKSGVRELVLDFLDKMPVRKREPCFGCPGCLDAKERSALDDLSAAMQEHRVSGGWLFSPRMRQGEDFCLPCDIFFDEVDHLFSFRWLCVKQGRKPDGLRPRSVSDPHALK